MRMFRRAVSLAAAAACGLALTAAMSVPASAVAARGGPLGGAAHRGPVTPAVRGAAGQATGPATASCTGPFVKVPTPSPGSADDVLSATAAAAADDMWAVGRQNNGGASYQNLILFNGGHGWSQVAAPDPGAKSDDELTAVSTSGPSDAWAAGFYATGNPDSPVAAQALHWDGTSWNAEPLATLPGEFESDTGPAIVDISPTDAWLVGAYLGSTAVVSIIEHWDGTSWSLVSHPAVRSLTAVAASGPGDVWATGTGVGSSFPAVIEHYDGSAWTKSATLQGIALSGVTSISPSRAWAVGASQTTTSQTATVEWNGSAWNVVPSPNPSTDDALTAVSGVAGGGVWAVGRETDYGTGVGEGQPMAMHWDGTAWTAVPATGVAPDIFGGTGMFFGVTALPGSHVVAVGFGSDQADSLVADLCPFRVRDSGFSPSPARVSGPGAGAYWVIPASDSTDHRLVDGSGFGLFDSGPKAPGSSYAFAFAASGTYAVRDPSDGATEKVGVPILAEQVPGGRPELEWGSVRPAGARFDVQDIAPGQTTFAPFISTTATSHVLGPRLLAGTYKFRSRLRNRVTGAATGWSPTLTITVP
jgi:hypothetical protein